MRIKYFSLTEEGANAYARGAYQRWPSEGPYTIVRTTIDKDLIPADSAIPHLADRGVGDAVALPTDVLPSLGRPRILPYGLTGSWHDAHRHRSRLPASRRAVATGPGRCGGPRVPRRRVPDVGFGCDAQILPAYLAHDRYGGTYDTQHAQLLENLRGDGAPDLIIVTPAYAAGGQPTDLALLEERLLFIFRECLAVAEQAADGDEKPRFSSVLLHLGVLGIEKYDVGTCTRALRRALDPD